MTKELLAVKEFCEEYRQKTDRYELRIPKLTGKTRIKGISISDLHIPLIKEDLVKEIVKRHSGEDFCVVNGDLFDATLISKFVKEKEVPFIVEYNASLELIKFLSKNFKEVILVDGNHDSERFNREIQKVNPTVQFLIKKGPLEYLAKGQVFSVSGEDLGCINLPNVTYSGNVNPRGWWYKIGKTIFCHRLTGFRKNELRNATYMADHFINRGVDFQCLVSGHSHRVGYCAYRGGRLVIDQGALCYPHPYTEDGRGGGAPADLGYAVVEMDSRGNVDVINSRPIYLGTYQERENG